MATYHYYGLTSNRAIWAAISGLGLVWSDTTGMSNIQYTSFTKSSGGDTYIFHTGPPGGPDPPSILNLGIKDDYLAWNGYRATTLFTPVVWTTTAADPDVLADGAVTFTGHANTRAYTHVLTLDSSRDGLQYDSVTVCVVAYWNAGTGSWNYVATEGTAGVGSIKLAGFKLVTDDLQTLAELIANMIQIVNNVTVGSDLTGKFDQMITILTQLEADMGEFGIWGSFDAAMDLLIKKFGAEGPFAQLHDDLVALSGNFGDGGPFASMRDTLIELLAVFGAGGILGMLGTGGSLGQAVGKLAPLLDAVQAIGGVADAIIEYQQLGKLDAIAGVLTTIAANVEGLKSVTASELNSLRRVITWDDSVSVGGILNTELPGITGGLGLVAGDLSLIHSDLHRDTQAGIVTVQDSIEGLTFEGGGGGTVDLGPLITELEAIRQSLPASGGNFDMDRLQTMLDRYFIVEQQGTTFNLAYLIISLLNTGWIVYK